MKIVIFGTRKFNNYSILKQVVESTDSYKKGKITCVISGRAKGADTLGEQWAREKGIELILMPANWERYGRAAGPIRNKQMAEIADAAIGFWDGNTIHSGTYNMINTCKKLKVPLLVYRVDTGDAEINL